MLKRSFLSVALVAMLLGCGGDDSSGPDERVNLNGQWIGVVTVNQASTTITLTLSHNRQNNTIQGAGTFTVPGVEAIALTVSGTYVRPNVTFTMSASGYEDMNFTGTYVDGTITGQLNGSGFVNVSVSFNKS